jgi:hypothetical protein
MRAGTEQSPKMEALVERRQRGGRRMSDSQRLLVIAALVVIGVVLAFQMLEWSSGGNTRIIVFYEKPYPLYPSVTLYMGIYTKYGLAGILLGVIAPICFFAVAGFIALGTTWRTSRPFLSVKATAAKIDAKTGIDKEEGYRGRLRNPWMWLVGEFAVLAVLFFVYGRPFLDWMVNGGFVPVVLILGWPIVFLPSTEPTIAEVNRVETC